jgi:predicted MFS family arabinose efflux permease
VRPSAAPNAGRRQVRTVAARSAAPGAGWAGLLGAFAAFGFAYSVYTTYLVSALVDDAGFTPAHASAVYTLFGAAWIFGGPLLGRLSDVCGRGRTLVAGYSGMACSVVMLITGVEPFAALSALAFGLAMSGLPAVMAAQLADHLSLREFAGAFSRLTLVFGAAQLVGPPVAGWLAEGTGSFTIAFLLAAAVAGLGAASCLVIPREQTG